VLDVPVPLVIVVLGFGSLTGHCLASLRFFDAYFEDEGVSGRDRRGQLLYNYLMPWAMWRQPPFNWRSLFDVAANPRTERRRRARLVTFLAIPAAVGAMILVALQDPTIPLPLAATLVLAVVVVPLALVLWPENVTR
jgi:hypothetical protein